MRYILRTSFAGSMRKWSVPEMNGVGNGTRSVTFRGSSWYRHSRQVGSHAIDFMQEFFGMSYTEAVSYLLDGEQGQIIERGKRQETKRKPAKAREGTAGCRQRTDRGKKRTKRAKGTETAGEKSDHEESLCISSAETSY